MEQAPVSVEDGIKGVVNQIDRATREGTSGRFIVRMVEIQLLAGDCGIACLGWQKPCTVQRLEKASSRYVGGI